MAHTGLLAIQEQSWKHRRQSSAGIDHSRGLRMRIIGCDAANPRAGPFGNSARSVGHRRHLMIQF